MARGPPKPGARPKSRTNVFKHLKPALIYGGSMGSDRPTSSRGNRYDILSNQDDMDTLQETIDVEEERPPKPPPIVADSNIPLREIQHLLGTDCLYKRTSVGTKIFPQNFEKYEFCKKTLKDSQIEFHSYNSKENRLFTVFLHGLPKINTKDITDELVSYNLTPASVTEVNTRYSSANDAVFKVQFVRKNFTPSYLQNVQTINNVMITWRKQKPKSNNKPTQCWNCLMYGHGGEHCNRRPACMMCANQHHTNDCPFNKNDKKPAVFTCFNCKKFGRDRTDHSANDLNCPLRAHYLEVREKATTKQTRRVPSVRRNSRAPAPFPQQCNANNNVTNIHQHHSEDPRSYASQLKNNSRSDLFTIDELFNIFTSALDDLGKCTSKVQQMYVVMSMVKQAYDIK